MTFNVRYDKPDPGDLAWSVRRESVLHLIREHSPDVLCTQECQPHQLVELLVGLPGYAVVGRDRRGTGRDEYCAILYKHDRFERDGHGDIDLAPSYLPRIATWAALRDRRTGLRFGAVNTHLDHEDRLARIGSIELILGEGVCSQHTVITGDFNEETGSTARAALELLCWKDALSGVDDRLTYVDFDGEPRLSIDTVYYPSKMRLVNVVVDRSEPLGVRPSDHYPVIADLEVQR